MHADKMMFKRSGDKPKYYARVTYQYCDKLVCVNLLSIPYDMFYKKIVFEI